MSKPYKNTAELEAAIAKARWRTALERAIAGRKAVAWLLIASAFAAISAAGFYVDYQIKKRAAKDAMREVQAEGK